MRPVVFALTACFAASTFGCAAQTSSPRTPADEADEVIDERSGNVSLGDLRRSFAALAADPDARGSVGELDRVEAWLERAADAEGEGDEERYLLLARAIEAALAQVKTRAEVRATERDAGDRVAQVRAAQREERQRPAATLETFEEPAASAGEEQGNLREQGGAW